QKVLICSELYPLGEDAVAPFEPAWWLCDQVSESRPRSSPIFLRREPGCGLALLSSCGASSGADDGGIAFGVKTTGSERARTATTHCTSLWWPGTRWPHAIVDPAFVWRHGDVVSMDRVSLSLPTAFRAYERFVPGPSCAGPGHFRSSAWA